MSTSPSLTSLAVTTALAYSASIPAYCAILDVPQDHLSQFAKSFIPTVAFFAGVGACKVSEWTWNHILSAECLLKGENKHFLNLTLSLLAKSGILTLQNRATLIQNSQHAEGLCWGISVLYDANILTQATFNKLIETPEAAEALGMELAAFARLPQEENIGRLFQEPRQILRLADKLAAFS